MEYRIRIIDILPKDEFSRRCFLLMNSTYVEVDTKTYCLRNKKITFTLDFYQSTLYLESPQGYRSFKRDWHHLEDIEQLVVVFITNDDNFLTWELILI